MKSKKPDLILQLRASDLKFLVSSLSTFTEINRVKFSSEGIEIIDVDPSHTRMVKIRLGKDAFKTYQYKQETLMIDSYRIYAITNRMEDHEIVKLEHVSGSENMTIKSSRGFVWELTLPDDYDNEFKYPNLSWEGQTTIDFQEFMDRFSLLKRTMDPSTYTFILNPKGLVVSAKKDKDSARFTMSSRNLKNHSVEKRITAMYNNDIATMVISAMRDCTVATLSISENYPMQFETKFAEGHGEAIFTMAPMLEDD